MHLLLNTFECEYLLTKSVVQKRVHGTMRAVVEIGFVGKQLLSGCSGRFQGQNTKIQKRGHVRAIVHVWDSAESVDI